MSGTLDEQALLARLRGGLVPAHPGARGLYHMTLNPGCVRLRVATAAGLSMRQVADILGVKVREGQSLFALDRGTRFEERLYESGAARLLELFRAERGWPVADSRVLDLRDVAPLPGGSAEAAAAGLARRAAATQRALTAKAAGHPRAVNLLVQPVLLIQVVGVAYPIIPDVLAASSAEPFYLPGEVKSYPDRGSKTDPADVAAAARQAAVATVGLRQWATGTRTAGLVGDQAHLVLARPGSLQPTLHTQSVRHEVAVLDRALTPPRPTCGRSPRCWGRTRTWPTWPPWRSCPPPTRRCAGRSVPWPSRARRRRPPRPARCCWARPPPVSWPASATCAAPPRCCSATPPLPLRRPPRSSGSAPTWPETSAPAAPDPARRP